MNYKEIPKGSGIYKILSNVNKKVYIGSAKSLRRRAYEHFSALRRGDHYNLHLQRAWDSYGESNFSFIVLEECQEEFLLQKETFHLESFQAYKNDFGYNMEHPFPTWLGRKHSPETIAKIKAARAKQVFSPESIKKGALTRTGITPNFSKEALEAFRQRSKNMDRSFCKTDEFRKKISEISREKSRARGKKFICNQNQKIYHTCGEAGRDLKISYKVIWKVLNGKLKTIHGYTFTYLTEPSASIC